MGDWDCAETPQDIAEMERINEENAKKYPNHPAVIRGRKHCEERLARERQQQTSQQARPRNSSLPHRSCRAMASDVPSRRNAI
jgi:hypothetical protein